MRVNAQKNSLDRFYKVFDANTGVEIPDCLWADDETGEHCILVRGEDGNIEIEWGNPKYRHLPIERWKTKENEKYGGLQPKTTIKTGNIKLVNTGPAVGGKLECGDS